jgi:predicted DNA-binding protein
MPKRTSVNLDADSHAKLKALSEKTKFTCSALLRMMIENMSVKTKLTFSKSD